MTITIIGVSVENRLESAVNFQKIITEFGCEISTRIGLHTSAQNICLNKGIVLLEVRGDAELLKTELQKYWDIQTMLFE